MGVGSAVIENARCWIRTLARRDTDAELPQVQQDQIARRRLRCVPRLYGREPRHGAPKTALPASQHVPRIITVHAARYCVFVYALPIYYPGNMSHVPVFALTQIIA